MKQTTNLQSEATLAVILYCLDRRHYHLNHHHRLEQPRRREPTVEQGRTRRNDIRGRDVGKTTCTSNRLAAREYMASEVADRESHRDKLEHLDMASADGGDESHGTISVFCKGDGYLFLKSSSISITLFQFSEFIRREKDTKKIQIRKVMGIISTNFATKCGVEYSNNICYGNPTMDFAMEL
ncbi:hypothetical protein LXL04_003286 [Taraxacum kok-saghyz]